VPIALQRIYGAHHLHFITNSCYRRLPLLGSARFRDRFLSILEQTRRKYRFVVVGYVVMPEPIHLLLSEPEVGSPSTVMQVLKQRTAHVLLSKRKRRDPQQRELFGEEPRGGPSGRPAFTILRLRSGFRQPAQTPANRLNFNVWSDKKRVEKLRYMHDNPVKRGLVESPEQWRWSSYRHYFYGEAGPVQVNVGWGKISFHDRVA
jgi:putative transposase